MKDLCVRAGPNSADIWPLAFVLFHMAKPLPLNLRLCGTEPPF